MRLSDLPHFARFRGKRDVKVLRHKDLRWDLWALRDHGEFGRYQNGQAWDVFGRARYVVSFIAERYQYAKFVGVWEVLSKRRVKGKRYRYTTRELPGFQDLEARLIVRWGEGTRSWAQWLHRQGDKEIVELLPRNYVMDFPGYYDFALSHKQLTTMIATPDANREWQRMLSAISGVYVVLDQRSGRQYVGSAYGKGGIWGRWRAYAKSPSGGNVILKQLLEVHPNRYKHFQFAILRVLEPNATREAALAQEGLAKRKLGSRAFGLNSN